eukprot:8453259-Pyramimonas_sp.AAC.1
MDVASRRCTYRGVLQHYCRRLLMHGPFRLYDLAHVHVVARAGYSRGVNTAPAARDLALPAV